MTAIEPTGRSVTPREATTSEEQEGWRTERDSMGDVNVPVNALYGAQTRRAIENFPISGLAFGSSYDDVSGRIIGFGRRFLHALGMVKMSAVSVNRDLGLLDDSIGGAIEAAAKEVADGLHDAHFPIDVFQTGSGTSTNMNANEVIANLANVALGQALGAKSPVHPNDHVNRGQSSNDVIPTAMQVSAVLAIEEELLPALEHLAAAIEHCAREHDHVVKTGRTHLMDAMPVTIGQEFGAWAHQVRAARARLTSQLPELGALALGGTAVGTGINSPAGFGKAVAARLAAYTGYPFTEAPDHFAAQASLDAFVATSGALNAAAVTLMKVANDLRWMNSGPKAGLAEITLPAVQPGSSIMPGKINPVIPEAAAMVAAQVMGNHTTITIAAQASNFQLSVMLPVVARNVLESTQFLAGAARVLADKAVTGLTVNVAHISELVERNPILVTALNDAIGYDKAAEIAKRAYTEGRRVKDVAAELTDLSASELDERLDPRRMT